MDILKFNNKLNKIAALADNGSADGAVSALERDLLLSYIRELYDIALDEKPSVIKTVTKPIQNEEPHLTQAQAAPHIISKPLEIPAEVPVPIQITEVKVPDPVVVHIPAEMQTAHVNIQVAPPVKTEMQTSNVSIQDTPSAKSKNPDVVAILEEIFIDEKVTDLSDKLSLTPIRDLTKSMGINEKIFTQQELFGNDQNVFNDTLMKMNDFGSFDEAKKYLIDHIIHRYGWTNENKVKKAATFVRLVKRKYT